MSLNLENGGLFSSRRLAFGVLVKPSKKGAPIIQFETHTHTHTYLVYLKIQHDFGASVEKDAPRISVDWAKAAD